MFQIWVDGSCRNNQGEDKKAACRVVYDLPNGKVFQETFDLGNTSNNIAEVTAIRKGLEAALRLGEDRVEILSDSSCALSWIARANKDGVDRCISKHSTLPDARKAEVMAEINKIFDLIGQIKHVEINQCKGSEQRADFGYK